MAAPRKKKASEAVELKRLQQTKVAIPISGITPYIPHRWSVKSKEMMPGHPKRDTMTKKGVREPEQEAEACVYRLPDGRPGIPATAIKAAMVDACRFFDKPSMVEARVLFHIIADGSDVQDGIGLVALKGADPELREDTPRNANGSADLRYRYQFSDWSAEVKVEFVPTSISPESIVALLDAAGRIGVGDWRPGSPKSKTGTFGQFRVEA